MLQYLPKEKSCKSPDIGCELQIYTKPLLIVQMCFVFKFAYLGRTMKCLGSKQFSKYTNDTLRIVFFLHRMNLVWFKSPMKYTRMIKYLVGCNILVCVVTLMSRVTTKHHPGRLNNGNNMFFLSQWKFYMTIHTNAA